MRHDHTENGSASELASGHPVSRIHGCKGRGEILGHTDGTLAPGAQGVHVGPEVRTAPKVRNRAQRSLDAIFASESFQDWQRRLGETAKRDAEKRAARRSEPSNSYRMVNVEARREFGTYRGKP